VVVISRLTEGLAGKRFLQDTVEATLHQHISADYHFLEAKNAFVHPEFQPVHICHVNPLDISSTDIRNRIRAGCSVDGMVPANVLQYIDRWELYR
jgi:nicotinate-nucleotide adenylyltransferase